MGTACVHSASVWAAPTTRNLAPTAILGNAARLLRKRRRSPVGSACGEGSRQLPLQCKEILLIALIRGSGWVTLAVSGYLALGAATSILQFSQGSRPSVRELFCWHSSRFCWLDESQRGTKYRRRRELNGAPPPSSDVPKLETSRARALRLHSGSTVQWAQAIAPSSVATA